MNDGFVTAINAQKFNSKWVGMITENMANVYTPGFREAEFNFRTVLDGAEVDEVARKSSQGKSTPGTSTENVFLEGKGFFLTKTHDNKVLYTRLGEFKFDGEGVYKTATGETVQGYILNDNGEVMATPSIQGKKGNNGTEIAGGPAMMATTDIKLWIDPSNGKYLGKYEEYEIKEDGIIYGKADEGKVKVPLYKIAVANFHDPSSLTEVKNGYFIENDISGKPVASADAKIRSGLIEMSNTDFKANVAYMQQAKFQMDMTNKLINTNKTLLQEAIKLIQ